VFISSDLQYHLSREAMERAAAESASTERARDIHNALADHHADLAWSINEGYGEVIAFPAVAERAQGAGSRPAMATSQTSS
jgi:muramoyltetrapeptide carboxypeptidase LdcA involved in peptidoglycan recycling